MATSTRPRVRAGIPSGGQFATEARNEPGLTLLDPVGDSEHAEDVLTSMAARSARFQDASTEEIDALSFHLSDHVRENAAKAARDPFVLDRLARDEQAWVRRAVAENTHTPSTLLIDLTSDPADGVRLAARKTLTDLRASADAEQAAREPVVGPDRARAAARAIAEMSAARYAREMDPWSDATHQRLIEARRVRDQYPEYDDSPSGR